MKPKTKKTESKERRRCLSCHVNDAEYAILKNASKASLITVSSLIKAGAILYAKERIAMFTESATRDAVMANATTKSQYFGKDGIL